jgi:hypothetical protein
VAATVVWPRRRGERRESPRRESCSPMYSQSAGIKRRRARAPGGAHAGEPPDTRQGPAAAALGLGRWSRPCQVSHGGGERHKLVPDPYYYESKKKYYYESKTSTPWGRGWMILAIEMGWARWSMAMGTETCLTVGFAHAHSFSPFPLFRLKQLTLFQM